MLGVVLAAVLLAADKEKIAVVDLDAPPGMLGLSTQVTKAIVNEAMKTRRNVITPDDLRDKLGNKQMNEVAKCADRPACAAEKLTVIGANKAILGRLNRDEKNYVLQLWFVDLDGLHVISEVDRSVLIASRRFQKDVEAAIPGFLRGEREAQGTVTINATTVNAQVSINGEFMGVAPITTSLKPGKYEVKVEKPKYLPMKRFVNVEPNQKSVEEFRMLLIPGEREDELAPLVGQKKPEGEGQGSGFSISAPTIVAGVGTLAAAGIGIGFGVISSGQYEGLKKGYNATTDTYSGTREQALAAQRNATVANVCFGIAGAALITTVVLAVLDARSGGDEPKLEVAPAASPGGAAGLIIGGRF